MANIIFSTAVANLAANPSVDLLAGFDPLVDVLVVDTVDPTGMRVSVSDAGLVLTINNKSLTVPGLTLPDVPVNGWLQFKAGGVFLVGDGTASAVSDDGDDDLSTLASFQNDHIRGLGGADTIDGGKGSDLIYGNTGDDVITGTTADAGNDTVFGGAGNDVIAYASAVAPELIYGNLGDDTLIGALQGKNKIYAGQGEDIAIGGNLDDKIYGNAGNDTLLGGIGNNTLFGGQGEDVLTAGAGNGHSWVYGNLGDDSLIAGIAGDTMLAGQGNDTMIGGAGADLMRGNLGDDSFYVGDKGGKDTLSGGAGFDTFNIDITTGGDIRIDDFIGTDDRVELHGVTALQLVKGAYGTAITSSTNKDSLLKGTDLILKGGAGTVTIAGGAGQALDANNLILDNHEALAVNLGGQARTLTGTENDDILVAGDIGDTLIGGGGADTALGGLGNDLLDESTALVTGVAFHAGAGEDTLIATLDGDDTITVNTSGLEHVILSWGDTDGTVELTLTQAGTQSLTVTAADLTETQSVLIDLSANKAGAAVTLGAGGDTLIGAAIGSQGDTLDGGDGNDSITGYSGRDTLFGAAGADTLDGGIGQDTLTGGDGVDVFVFASGDSGMSLTSIDHLTDFTAFEDRIIFTDGSDVTVFDLSDSDFSAAKSLLAALNLAYTAAEGINAQDVILFDYAGATYLYLNDGDDELSTSADLLIDVTGIAIAPDSGDFVAPDA